MDGGSSDTGREPEGAGVGMGTPGTGGDESSEERTGLTPSIHPIVEKDGFRFYEITRYGKHGEYKQYMQVDGPWEGHGSPDRSDPALRARLALGRQSALQAKARRAEDYEDKVYGALESVAKLQTDIVSLALDPSSQPDRETMEKLRLGLAASESILNRALGKAVTKIDADVKHSVADEIAEIEAEWVVEE